MIALLKWLLARWALFKLLLKSFGALAWLLPLAMLLKALGWPVLLVLGILAVPLLIVLMIVGLPLLLVAAAAGIMLMIAFWVVSTGMLLIKIAVPILLIVWVVRWIRRSNRGHSDGSMRPRSQGGGPADEGVPKTEATDQP